jgi:SAM-dependent methyltransferase
MTPRLTSDLHITRNYLPLNDEVALVRRSASTLYADGQEIWHEGDEWNRHKRKSIEEFILRTIDSGTTARRVLDVGCGSSKYEWMQHDRVSADRFYQQVDRKTRAIVCDLERLPFKDGSFDLTFCIGSVLNYTSAIESIAELSRVTARCGRLYLHFETSSSCEHLGRASWNAPVHLNETINASRPDTIWVYSPSFIFRSLENMNFRVIQQMRFHILSAVLLRLGFGQARAARAGKFDRCLGALAMLADDVIVLAEKI